MAEVTDVDREIPRVDFSNLQVGTRRYYGSIYNNRRDIPEDEGEGTLYIALPRMTNNRELESFLGTIANFIPEAEPELRGHTRREEEDVERDGFIVTADTAAGIMNESAPRRTITDIKLGWESK